jgi:poly(3-hydroxybutyrate) depolymerase
MAIRRKHREFYDESRRHGSDRQYYLQTVDTVFVRHALPKGEMTHRGRRVDPGKIRNCALLTIEGEHDVSPARPDRAAHKLCVNIPLRKDALPAAGQPLWRVQRLALPLWWRRASPTSS